jgi:AraC-like DNA-binding protein
VEDATVGARHVGDVLVLTLPDSVRTTGSAALSLALLGAVSGPAPTTIVLDLRAVDLVTVHTARTLIEFARGCADRGIGCVLLPDSGSTATAMVLDTVDPTGTVPRVATLDQALAGQPDEAEQPPSNTAVFASTDLDRIEEFLSASYAPVRITSAGGGMSAHVVSLAAGSVRVDRVDLAFELGYDTQPLNRICLSDIESGTVDDQVTDGSWEPAAFGPGDLFALVPADRPHTGRADRVCQQVTVLDPALLTQVAGVDREIRLLDHRPHHAAHLRAAIAHLRDDVLSVPDVADNALVVSTATRYLAACVLHAFPNDALTVAAHVDRHDAHLRTLRRAIAFIEANADRDINAADIAGAAYVTARAVQLAFRRHLGMTPMAYLRRVRLDCARAELRAADPADTTVTQVGARWGYGRASTFAAHYRAAYGESPSQTLRPN